MRNNNIYKILFFVSLTLNIIFVVFVFWAIKKYPSDDTVTQEETFIENQSDCQKELEASNDVVEEYNGISKPVNFSNFPEAKTYYTMITKSIEEGPNFAGHFTVARWGCGTDTLAYSIVDNKTGDIIAYSDCLSNYNLRSFSLDSSHLVLEPVYAGQTREYYKIVDDKLELACSEVSTADMYPQFPE